MTVAEIAMIGAALLGVGYVFVGLLIVWPATSNAARPILPILNTETIIAVAVVVPFLLPPAVRVPLLIVFAARIVWEAAKVAILRRGDGLSMPVVIAATAASALFAGLLQQGLDGMTRLAAVAAVVVVLLGALMAARRRGNDSLAGLCIETALFPGLPLGLAVAAAAGETLAALLLGAFILVETFDSYALLGGKLFGRTRIFPRLSPNKTAEGLGFGAAMMFLTATGLAWATGIATMQQAVLAALVAGLATVSGDLLASRLKRASGVKDYPPIMRHQGGVLDIADAMLIAGALVALLPN
ncbi:MAG: phosphatidate cytidylyltransferase [Mesorhizobium sp.]